MSKQIDFTQPGGFPLTQDQLGYLQEAWLEMTGALASIMGDGTGPYVVSGCVVTRSAVGGTVYAYSNTAGWVVYGGQMIRVPAAALGNVDESVNGVYMQITASGAPLTFNNGSTPNVILDSTGALVAQPIGTANTGTLFLMVNGGATPGMIPIGNGKAIQSAEGVWNSGIGNTIPVSMNTDKEQMLYYQLAGGGNYYALVDTSALVLGSKVTIVVLVGAGSGNIILQASGDGGTGQVMVSGSNVVGGSYIFIELTYKGSGALTGTYGHIILAKIIEI